MLTYLFFSGYFFHFLRLLPNWKLPVSSAFSQRLYCLIILITLTGLSVIALSQLRTKLDKMLLHHSTEYIYRSFWKCSCPSIPLYTLGFFLTISWHSLLLLGLLCLVAIESFIFKKLHNQPLPSLYLKCYFSLINFFLI